VSRHSHSGCKQVELIPISALVLPGSAPGMLTFMRLKRSACQRTNLFVFFFTILGRDAGRRELLELDILLATAFQISGWFSTDPHA
jgi:hypothetical protein